MPVPPFASPLEQLGQRPFSFYPPILNIEHNEWIFQRSTWSEVLVLNRKTSSELWVPRRFLGEISRIDEPVVIVGLNKELEYKSGQVWPHVRRLIEMPKAVNEGARPAAAETEPGAEARPSVVKIRMESPAESRIGRLIGAALLVGVLGCVLLVVIFRSGPEGNRVRFSPVFQSELGLTADHDYLSVVRRLGAPTEDRWQSEKGEIQYRILSYPDRGFHIILMGKDRDNARYIGALDRNWRVIDSVKIPGGNTASVLRNLKRF
ncbi:MAG: hypothetical protein HYS04_10815 [Acidobacteria bacterium]|nr:hypothetical protein [Acidobacteriota bacterium]